MRPLLYRPSSVPPVSDRDLERYAGKWVIVRGGKVVQHASSYDELTARRKRPNDGDRILRLPPVASSSADAKRVAHTVASQVAAGRQPDLTS